MVRFFAGRGTMFKSQTLLRLLCLLLLAAPLGRQPASAAPAPAQPGLWQRLAPGIDYRQFYLPTPNRVYVARMEINSPQATIESSIGQGRVSGGAETVRDQAARYDEAITYWGREWGGRNHVVVAINGSFFNTSTGVPWSGLVHSGWYALRFEDHQESSGFAWTLDRQAFIGTCVVHRPAKQQAAFLDGGASLPIDGINVVRPDDGLILYTPQYDARTPGTEKGRRALEFLVELEQPLTLTPQPAGVAGVLRQILDGKGGAPIPFDSVILSASGKTYDRLLDRFQAGERVLISQELRHLDASCQQPNPASWTNTFASVAGSFIFLRAGKIERQDDDVGAVLRNPRTAVALNQRYVYFIVVDGRDRLGSLGMSMVELAVFARNYLSATDGMALDGGGSSTMVIDGKVVNRPKAETAEEAQVTPVAGSQGKVERAVANGLMMVTVLPKQLSTKFKAGDAVVLDDSSDVNVRLGPGTNFGILTALPPGSQGVVVAHALDGVLAKGYSWWKIDFNGTIGWVNEQSLSGR